MAKLHGLTGDWIRFPHVAQELMNDPDAFLTKNPVKTEDFACPHEAHEALKRGVVLGEAMMATCDESEAKKVSLPDSLKALRATAAQHFGDDFIAETIPFGILFRERAQVEDAAKGLSFTGTGSCTFCKDNDSPDFD